jgi:hypothetical protein
LPTDRDGFKEEIGLTANHIERGNYLMADIYSKGTRVWFPDKEQGWISAEVTTIQKGTKDGLKITFVDERGKVCVFSSPLYSF